MALIWHNLIKFWVRLRLLRQWQSRRVGWGIGMEAVRVQEGTTIKERKSKWVIYTDWALEAVEANLVVEASLIWLQTVAATISSKWFILAAINHLSQISQTETKISQVTPLQTEFLAKTRVKSHQDKETAAQQIQEELWATPTKWILTEKRITSKCHSTWTNHLS